MVSPPDSRTQGAGAGCCRLLGHIGTWETRFHHLLETAIKRGNIIHFVNEDLQLVTQDDLKTIQRYLDFAKYGRSILPIGLPLSDTTKLYFNKWSGSIAKYHDSQAR